MTVSAAAPLSKKEPRKTKTRIARFCLPQIDANSALLPPDSWILKTVRDLARHNKSFHDTIGHAALWAAGGLVAAMAGVTALLVLPLALPVAAAIGIAAAGAAVFAGFRTKTQLDRFMAETVPDLRMQIGKKYLQYKMSELKSAWQKNLGERRSKTPEKKPSATKIENPAPAEPQPTAPKKPQITAAASKTEDGTPQAKPPGGALGAWATRMAEEAAKKRAQKQAAAPKDNAAPKPPAPGPK